MKEAKIRQWVDDKRILPVEPSSLLYMIWASTQHYADFDHQVNILNDHQPLSDMQFERAVQTVTSVIVAGDWVGALTFAVLLLASSRAGSLPQGSTEH